MGALVSITTLLPDMKTPLAYGSGFCVGQDPLEKAQVLVATNYHILKGSAAAILRPVPFRGSDEMDSESVRFVDKIHDIALLSLEMKRSSLPLAQRPPAVGGQVYALGNPEGFEGSFSSGLVSAIRITDPPQIQITAPISHGSSGGPVLNRFGQVIGMVQSTFSEGQNLNFTVPSALISVALPAYVADPRATSEYAWNAITEDKLPNWKLVHHGDGLDTYYAADSITTVGEGRRTMWVLVRTTWPNSEDTFMNLMAFDCTRRWSTVLKFYRPGEPVIDKNPDSWTQPEETTLVNTACGKRINDK